MKCIVPALLCLLVVLAHAQDSIPQKQSNLVKDTPLIITTINISGNKKTQDNIIRRELPFAEGDTLEADNLPKEIITGEAASGEYFAVY